MMNPYDKEMNPLDKTGPSASLSSAASTAGRMGDSTSHSKQKKKATNYINQYLRKNEYLPNSIDELTDEHMEGEHLKNFMENFGKWLARTKFDTKQKTSLGNKTKEEYFKMSKEVLKLRSSDHPCFNDAPVWFPDMKRRFDKECKRSSMQNSDVSEERESQPFYSDLATSSGLNRLIRHKYAGDDAVDLDKRGNALD
jgi:hypothetical protein